MKFIYLLVASTVLILLSSCITTPMQMSDSDISIYPRGSNSWLGDAMPFYDGELFRIFYLDDLRSGTKGFHPWSLLTTNNFLQYEVVNQVIPFGEKPTSRDFALGTGSVIIDENGLYHAYYTGFNPGLRPKEAIMHAISSDLIHWEKIPEDTFFASENYYENDFRDPYVFYNTDYNEYWMLITTREDNMGVITHYTSKDLKVWKDAGVLFINDLGSDSNLECSTLIKYGDYWYLGFSDQWPDRVFHYRKSKYSNGPFNDSKDKVIDGNGFYAGRLETDGKDLYVFGWNPTRDRYMDDGKYNWGGNLVSHKLVKMENGDLKPVPNENVIKYLNNKKEINQLNKSETVSRIKNSYSFSGIENEFIEFEKLYGIFRIKGSVEFYNGIGIFGITFNTNDKGIGTSNFVFDFQEQNIHFYNKPTTDLEKNNPESSVDFNFEEGDTLDFTIIVDDSTVVMYVDNEIVISARIFSLQRHSWGLFSNETKVEFIDLGLYE